MIKLSLLCLLFSSFLMAKIALASSNDEQLQARLNTLASKTLHELNATKILIVAMNSTSGKIVALVDVNASNNAQSTPLLEYAYEPGSVMKPISFSIALEKKLVNPDDHIDTHGGTHRYLGKLIKDAHPFKSLSAQDVIVHSSNIGIVSITKDLDASDFYDGLMRFGFANAALYEDSDEALGVIPSPYLLKDPLYKAAASYGYGVMTTLTQLVKAYSVFNNEGEMVLPSLNEGSGEREAVISKESAVTMKDILIKVVKEGTGKNANVKGLEIGGKTGSAHMALDGNYINAYRTSFVGFANDNANNKYIIGVMVEDSKISNYASDTAAPLFGDVVRAMATMGYLKN